VLPCEGETGRRKAFELAASCAPVSALLIPIILALLPLAVRQHRSASFIVAAL
jgi:hypothetical protein